MSQGKISHWAVFWILLMIFVATEFKGLSHYDNSDENIYFYMAKLVSEGELPYRDFFFSHPPLQLVPNVIIFLIFGFNIFLLKSAQLLFVIISAIFIFKIAKKEFGGQAGLMAVILFLFSNRILLEATYDLGINLATMLFVISLYNVINESYGKAGVFAGLAAATSLLAVVPLAAVGIALILLKKRKNAEGILRPRNAKRFFGNWQKYFLSALLIFGIINILMFLIAGQGFIDSVYKYHLLKPRLEGNSLDVFVQVAKANIVIAASALLFLFYKTKKLIFVWLPAIAYLIFLIIALNRIFNFYFVLLFPLLAILGGYSLSRLAGEQSKGMVFAILSIAVITSLFFTVKYMYAVDFANFETAPQIASFIRENSGDNGLVFGDSTSVPLIALFSGRKIALDMVDTNEMTFLSGLVGENDTLSRLRAIKPKFVVVRPLYGIGSLEFFQQYLANDCRLARAYNDFYWGDFLVYDCA